MLAADLMLIPHFPSLPKKGEGVEETKGVEVKILEKLHVYSSYKQSCILTNIKIYQIY